jgi:hypothetical protein
MGPVGPVVPNVIGAFPPMISASNHGHTMPPIVLTETADTTDSPTIVSISGVNMASHAPIGSDMFDPVLNAVYVFGEPMGVPLVRSNHDITKPPLGEVNTQNPGLPVKRYVRFAAKWIPMLSNTISSPKAVSIASNSTHAPATTACGPVLCALKYPAITPMP